MTNEQIIDILGDAIRMVSEKSNNNTCVSRALEEYYKLIDKYEENNKFYKDYVTSTKKEILKASKHAGYTNYQCELARDVEEMLENIK